MEILMNVKLFFGRRDVRIIIIGTVTGRVLQILSQNKTRKALRIDIVWTGPLLGRKCRVIFMILYCFLG